MSFRVPRGLFFLKATAGFRDLQVQLEGTENRIAVERMRFNEAAQAFNTKRQSFPTVLIDLRRGVIHPLRTLQGDGGVTTFVRSVRTGPFARVAGTGDCLNVRETASADATVLGCYRDGVLLRLGADPATRSESAWLPVETLDGRHGFAAAAYLER